MSDVCLVCTTAHIRGAEVVGMLNADGKLINRLNPDEKGHPRGELIVGGGTPEGNAQPRESIVEGAPQG